MKEELTQIGRKIRQRREALEYTQSDVSEISGVAERTIRSIEGGVNTNMANLIKVLDVLGLSLSVDIKQVEYGD
jgi:transcriptional regulator with XRE-family HTH domain